MLLRPSLASLRWQGPHAHSGPSPTIITDHPSLSPKPPLLFLHFEPHPFWLHRFLGGWLHKTRLHPILQRFPTFPRCTPGPAPESSVACVSLSPQPIDPVPSTASIATPPCNHVHIPQASASPLPHTSTFPASPRLRSLCPSSNPSLRPSASPAPSPPTNTPAPVLCTSAPHGPASRVLRTTLPLGHRLTSVPWPRALRTPHALIPVPHTAPSSVNPRPPALGPHTSQCPATRVRVPAPPSSAGRRAQVDARASRGDERRAHPNAPAPPPAPRIGSPRAGRARVGSRRAAAGPVSRWVAPQRGCCSVPPRPPGAWSPSGRAGPGGGTAGSRSAAHPGPAAGGPAWGRGRTLWPRAADKGPCGAGGRGVGRAGTGGRSGAAEHGPRRGGAGRDAVVPGEEDPQTDQAAAPAGAAHLRRVAHVRAPEPGAPGPRAAPAAGLRARYGRGREPWGWGGGGEDPEKREYWALSPRPETPAALLSSAIFGQGARFGPARSPVTSAVTCATLLGSVPEPGPTPGSDLEPEVAGSTERSPPGPAAGVFKALHLHHCLLSRASVYPSAEEKGRDGVGWGRIWRQLTGAVERFLEGVP